MYKQSSSLAEAAVFSLCICMHDSQIPFSFFADKWHFIREKENPRWSLTTVAISAKKKSKKQQSFKY